MKIHILFASLFLTGNCALSQLPYSENQYSYRVETDHQYSIAPNFANMQDTLMLDIYKPVGDNNCRRPCLVLVHGGAWIAGSKEDALMVTYATEFAKKGWVVGVIDYRLGMHKAANYTQYALCTGSLSVPCGYVADTAEVIRANYRGQQDAKNAIRFLKDRYQDDSTDLYNFFIAGESAGGFIAMSATFFDKDAEKPLSAGAIADAPTPDADLEGCLPPNYSLIRGNLDDIQGNPDDYNHDATVQGVGSIYGGIFNFSVIDNTSDWPVMYMYHQGSDVVVNYNYGRLLGRIDAECYAPNNLCQPYLNYPNAYGGKGIKLFLDGFTTLGPTFTADIVENYEYMNDCLDNGHSVDNPVLRAGNMADLFAQRVADNGNFPGTSCNIGLQENELPFKVAPNPSEGMIVIESSVSDGIVIYNSLGKVVYRGKISAGENKLDLTRMGKGVFMIQLESNPGGIIRLVIN